MTKDTHLVTGLSFAVAVARPETFTELAVCIASATIGSVISDIDVTTSKPRKELNKIMIISIAVLFIATLLEAVFHIGILTMIENQTNLQRILLGVLCFLFVCIFGMTTPHRTFMHSLTCVIILSGALWLVCPKAVLPYSVAMMSHIFIDLFNTKKVQILYPLKKPRICFKLCKADGKANKIICKVFSIIFVLEICIYILLKTIQKF